MILTPFISGLTTPLYAFRRRWFRYEPVQTINLPKSGFSDHLIIAGGGRVGLFVAGVLRQLDLKFVIIELGYRQVEIIKNAGMPIIYGDASQRVLLEAAQIEHARMLLITVPATIIVERIVQEAHKINPGLNIVARAEGIEQMKSLHAQGVYEVVQPEFEAGLEITRQALLHLNIPAVEIRKITDTIRREQYAPLYEIHSDYQAVSQLQNANLLLDITWVPLTPDSPLVGKTIKELGIRKKTGVSIVAVLNNGTLIPNPEVDYQFTERDILALMGTQHQLENFNKTIDIPVSQRPVCKQSIRDYR